MPCNNACLDCPFSRSADQISNPREVIAEHLVHPFDPYMCPEQDDICLGQLIMLANQCAQIMIEYQLMKRIVEQTPVDRQGFFWFNAEFMRYHEEGYIFGSKWLKDHYDLVKSGPYRKPVQQELF